jgi:hypothetical protein
LNFHKINAQYSRSANYPLIAIMNLTSHDITEFPRFKQYYLPSDQGQPIESAFEPGTRCFLLHDDETDEQAILQISETLNGRWRDYFEGHARTLNAHAHHKPLLPVTEIGVDDGMLYSVRPFTPSESLNSYSKRVGTLPWHLAAPMVRQLAECLREILRGSPTLFRRLDLASVRVREDSENGLGLEVVGCLRGELAEKSEYDRVQELCVLLTRLSDMREASDCVDRLIDHAYGMDEGDSPQNLSALLASLPIENGGSLDWLRRRVGIPSKWLPRSPFDHPELHTFRDHFAPPENTHQRGSLAYRSERARRTAALPFTATSICLFAVEITTSGWQA